MTRRIIDLQRRLMEVGRIRIGHQVAAGSSGKTRPAKLDTFRLTSADKKRIELVARVYGGQPQEWESPAGQQWEVITTTDALDVIVPPGDVAFSQAYETWQAGGITRRCDGQMESLSEGPCLCDPDNRECDIHTRLSVMLHDVPGLGVWRIDSSGYYAAVELSGAVEIIQMAAGQGQMLPARLRLEQRTVKRLVDGKPQTRRFAVPVLDIDISPGQLMAGVNVHGELPQQPPPALEAPPAALEQPPTPRQAPAPPPVQTAPAQAVKARQKRAAPPLPPTGRKPRTAAEAAAAPVDPSISDDMHERQRRKFFAMFGRHSIKGTDRLLVTNQVVGREVESSNDLTADEISKAIDVLQNLDVVDGEDFGNFLDRLAVSIATAGLTVNSDDDRDPDTGEIIPSFAQPLIEETVK